MKRIQLIISVVLFAGIIGAAVWLYFETRGAAPKSSLPEMLSDDIDLLMDGDVLMRESSKGRMSIEIAGRHFAYKEDSKEIKLSKPHIRVWPEDGGSFTIQGNKGFYYLEIPELQLEGEIKGLSEDGYELETDWLRYLPEDARVETDAPVRVSRSDFLLTGKGMTFDVQKRILEVASDAKVVIRRLGGEE